MLSQCLAHFGLSFPLFGPLECLVWCVSPHQIPQQHLEVLPWALGSPAEQLALQHEVPHSAFEARCHDEVNSC